MDQNTFTFSDPRELLAGVDEAGRGPLAGAVVAAAECATAACAERCECGGTNPSGHLAEERAPRQGLQEFVVRSHVLSPW